jgi:hypothetical protein
MRIGLARGAAVTAAVLGVLVVAIVARSSPTHPFVALKRGGAPGAASTPTRPTGTPSTGTGPVRINTDQIQNWPLVTVFFLLVSAAAVVVALLNIRLWWTKHAGGPVRRGRSSPGNPVSVPPAELARAIDAGFDELERGPVTDAIIACWLRVEAATAGAGMTRQAAETSAEFADRVLGSYGAREQPLRRLAALYREARFSAHPMQEHNRTEARACLDAIRADLDGAHANQ